MKKLLLFLLLAIHIPASSQTVSAYCDMQATNFWGGRNIYIILDLGAHGYGSITDSDGNAKKFSGIVDALNYMSKLGWSVVESYYITEGQKVLHFLLEKKITSDHQLLDGINIKQQDRQLTEKKVYKPGNDIY